MLLSGQTKLEAADMNTITIKNLSTFTDYSAVARVAQLIAGDEYAATHDDSGREVARIKISGISKNIYTVYDKEE